MGKVAAKAERCGAARPRVAATAAAFVLAAAVLTSVEAMPQPATQPPARLQDTGLYVDFATLAVDPQHLAFAPQYPLWTDGATKRRWIALPPGTAIDASDPDAWRFPIGTRLWKEFSFDGRRVETRYLERQADAWLYAAYAWSADGREAHLVSERGRRGAYPLGGGRAHAIPSVSDCKACHQGGASEVLGFSALQLSPDRDPAAPHAEPTLAEVDLKFLVDRRLVVGLPADWRETPPRIAARSATERAALGYLHGNCGHCHNRQGPLQNVGLFLRQTSDASVSPAVASAVGQPVRKPAPGQSPDAALRVEPGRADRSALMQRVRSRYPALQMPPLGTELADREAVALLERWIAETGALREEFHPHQKER
jgi:hypothetical protein